MFKFGKINRLIYSYLRGLITPTLTFIHLYPTNRCNLKCSYCYIVDNNYPDMSKKDIDAIMDKSLSLGTKTK